MADLIKRKEFLDKATKEIEQLKDNFSEFIIFIGWKEKDKIYTKQFVMSKGANLIIQCLELFRKFLIENVDKKFAIIFRRNKIAQWIIEKISARRCHCQCHRNIEAYEYSNNNKDS